MLPAWRSNFNPTTEKRFEEAFKSSEFGEQSALLNYLLDVEEDVRNRQAKFKAQIASDVAIAQEEYARGEFVTEEQLKNRLAARRAARRNSAHQEQAA